MISEMIYKLAMNKSFSEAYRVAYNCPFLIHLYSDYNQQGATDFYFIDGSHISFGNEYVPHDMSIPNKEICDKIKQRFYTSRISLLHQDVIEKHSVQAEVMLNEAIGLWMREVE